jgi:Flp pilus assembly protein TadD
MTPTLAHPPAEDLGRFVEGTLDDSERSAIVTHIADCDECRVVVVDSAEFIEPSVTQSPRYWWMAVAAAVVLVIAGGTFTYYERRDPLAKVAKEYARLEKRPIQARLSGFAYVPFYVPRGGNDKSDTPLLIMQAEAADAAAERSGNSAKDLHARGVALLLEGDQAADPITPLRSAANAEPNNVRYQTDLASALIEKAAGDPAKLSEAVTACRRALQVDPHSLDALFDLGLALERLGNTADAKAAYRQYLALDPSSRAAEEVRTNLEH